MVAATARFIPSLLHVDALMVADDGLTIRAISDVPGAHCPLCGERAERVHSRCVLTLADLPWADVAETSGADDLTRFARKVRTDLAAVQTGLTVRQGRSPPQTSAPRHLITEAPDAT